MTGNGGAAAGSCGGGEAAEGSSHLAQLHYKTDSSVPEEDSSQFDDIGVVHLLPRSDDSPPKRA